MIVPASADHLRHRDPRDTDGIDIRAVSHGHRGGRLQHKLVAYDAWPSKLLSGRNSINFVFDTDPDRKDAERVLAISYESGALRGVMFDVTSDKPERLGRVELTRADRMSVSARFRARLLGQDLSSYSWRARVLIVRNCNACSDHAPHISEPAIEHEL